MKTEKFDGEVVRSILAGIITQTGILSRLAPTWRWDMFDSKFANVLANQAIKYYNKYEKAPGSDIGPLFRSWCEKNAHDMATIEMGDRILQGVSDQYVQESFSVEYLLDMAFKHFREVHVRKIATNAQSFLNAGDLDKAEQCLLEFDKVGELQDTGSFLLTDRAKVLSLYEENEDRLIEMPSGLGEFYGHSLCREGFIAMVAPEKTGKTWMLIDFAWRAMSQRLRVAFFECGDMSSKQLGRRFMIRAAECPRKAKRVNWPVELNVGEVELEFKDFQEDIDWQKAWAACERVQQKYIKSKKPYFWYDCKPTGQVTVKDIQSTLKRLAAQDWLADCIIIDYADILAPPVGAKMDKRDIINENWMQMRAISMEFHCLVITASQCNRDGQDARYLTLKHNSDDKRKAAHVTGMVGMNATEEEKVMGLMRLNWMARREEEFSSSRFCWIASCIDLGQPTVLSIYPQSPRRKPVVPDNPQND